ncbi:MAG: PAS domain S-box protein, partial [Chloroflexi bacterium]|nr:PAS domain S-box protein [Chloroflexota bacterium]
MEALENSEAKYRDLVEMSHDLIWHCDLEGRFTYLNPAFKRALGYEAEEMLGRRFTEFEMPEQAAKDIEVFRSQLQGDEIIGYETKHLSKSGDTVYLVVNSRPLTDASSN